MEAEFVERFERILAHGLTSHSKAAEEAKATLTHFRAFRQAVQDAQNRLSPEGKERIIAGRIKRAQAERARRRMPNGKQQPDREIAVMPASATRKKSVRAA